MSDEDLAYPLHWPVGRPRARQRQAAAFREDGGRSLVTLEEALRRLLRELGRLAANEIVVSTDIRPRLYYGASSPSNGGGKGTDPGVAVYFRLGPQREQHCLACDKWSRLPDNIAAIAAHVDAVRGQLRWGVGDIAQAFAGYKALPAMGARRAWHEVLGVQPNSTAAQIKARWRELLERHHPDRGGNGNQAAEINAAYEEARAAGVA